MLIWQTTSHQSVVLDCKYTFNKDKYTNWCVNKKTHKVCWVNVTDMLLSNNDMSFQCLQYHGTPILSAHSYEQRCINLYINLDNQYLNNILLVPWKHIIYNLNSYQHAMFDHKHNFSISQLQCQTQFKKVNNRTW